MVKINQVRKSFFQNYGFISFLGDLFLINLLLLIALKMRYTEISIEQEKEIRVLVSFLNLSWFSLMYFGKTYVYNRVQRIDTVLARNMRYVLLHVLVGFAIIELLHIELVSRLVIVYFFAMFSVAIFLFRFGLIKYKKARTRRGHNIRMVVIVGGNETSRSIADHLLSDGAFGYEIIGVFNNQRIDLETDNGNVEWIGDRSDILPYLSQGIVQEIYVPISELDDEEFNELIKICDKKFIKLRMLPNLNRFTRKHKVGIEFYGNIPVFAFIRTPLENYLNRLIKRVFDIVGSILVICLVFTWLFPIVILIIKLTSKGPIFFKQKRSGINNSIFWIYKFRTMTVNPESDTKQATRDDPRITKFGKFMRKTNIDELPQFFNVLVGNMSIVGPRPHMLAHTEQYSALIDEYLERHYILPGITGWAQVHGYRGETRKLKMMRKRVEYDIWYVEHWTFLLDIRIIFLTTKNILKGEANAV